MGVRPIVQEAQFAEGLGNRGPDRLRAAAVLGDDQGARRELPRREAQSLVMRRGETFGQGEMPRRRPNLHVAIGVDQRGEGKRSKRWARREESTPDQAEQSHGEENKRAVI
jgi:hypothetical protein